MAPPRSPSGGPSSAGWNTNSTCPASCSRMPASASATPSRIATWPSWPHACITPTVSPRNCAVALDLNATSVCSVTGSASMSARSPTVRPGFAPRSNPTTPVTPTAVFTSIPSARRRFAICSAVRTSRLLSSGCAWKSRRHSIVFGSTAFAAASIWAPVIRVAAAWAPLWTASEIAIVVSRSPHRRVCIPGNLRVTRGRYGRNQGRYAPYRSALVQSCRVGVQGEQARALGE